MSAYIFIFIEGEGGRWEDGREREQTVKRKTAFKALWQRGDWGGTANNRAICGIIWKPNRVEDF